MNSISRIYYALFLVIMIGPLLFSSCNGVSKVRSDSKPISHATWDTLLQKHVDADGWVDYAGFLDDRAQFDQYTKLLSDNHPNERNWSRDERMAYWINAYNAFTVQLILDHYPVKSIKDIKKGIVFVNTVWDIKFIEIEGNKYDLNNIEHGILRKRWDDYRIHFAVNCASYSCPRLRNEAFTAANLEQLLDDQARLFINDTRKNNTSTGQLSSIFKWYSGDFKKGDNTVRKIVNQYADKPIPANTDISYMDYGWSLNDIKLKE